MPQPVDSTAADDLDEIGLELDFPAGWVDLPMDPDVDPDLWARAHAEAAGTGLPAEHLEAVSENLADAVRYARGGGPLALLGLAYSPDPTGPVLAVVEVHLVPFDDRPLTLEDAERRIGSAGADIGDRTVERHQLPCGPAVRVRRMRAEDGEGPPTFEPAAEGGPGEARVIEGVTWVALPPGLDGYAMMIGAWRAVVLGDELAARVDELAARLTVHTG